MGLFSEMLGKNSISTKLNNQESILGLIFSVIAIDGDISDEEVDDVISISKKSKILKDMPGSQFNAALEKIIKILTRDGIDSLIDLSTEGLSAEYREGAFAVCCDLVFSDGYIENEEELFLETLKSKLSINDNLAMQIVEVMSLKNSI